MKYIKTIVMGSLVLLIHCSMAQSTRIYFGLGGINNTFQDTRFTTYQYNTYSLKPEIGFTRISDQNIIEANASIFLFRDDFEPLDTTIIAVNAYNVTLSYLKPINSRWYIGGTWDIIDYYSRTNDLLENGANFYRTSSDFYLKTRYINEWKNKSYFLDFSYGLLSFINAAPGFSANFPQKVIDEGQVSFQNPNSRSAFYVQNMRAYAPWRHVYLKFQAGISLHKRLDVLYLWDLRRFSDEKSYPVTSALHSLMIRWNFIHKTKA